ncbi:MAG: hypothetical protein RBS68_12745 [Anaerolineales bacterium]|jgi:hypothetical protein|nr:hypothetical protein [Anaerolineales bacterium]
MENRNVAIAITVITALCCGCLALSSCVWGGIGLSGQPIATTVNGMESMETMSTPLALSLLCLAVIFIAVPIAVGFFTLRKKPAKPVTMSDGPIPPAL